MQSFIRGGVIAAAAAFLTFGYALAPDVKAQDFSEAAASDAATPADVTPKGPWSASVSYVTDDLVTSRGSAWRAKKASKGKVPGSTSPNNSAYWEVFAQGFNPLGAWSNATKYQ